MKPRGTLNDRQIAALLVIATCRADAIRALPGQTVGYLSKYGYVWREDDTYVLTDAGMRAVVATHRVAS